MKHFESIIIFKKNDSKKNFKIEIEGLNYIQNFKI